MLHIQKM